MQYFLIALFIVLIALDIYLAVDKIQNNTISTVIQDNTDNGLFILTYFWGAVAANLFFPTSKVRLVSQAVGVIILMTFASVIVIFNLEETVTYFMSLYGYNIYKYSISMGLGFIIGLLFWKQKAFTPPNKLH